jgi:hypothetical protein
MEADEMERGAWLAMSAEDEWDRTSEKVHKGLADMARALGRSATLVLDDAKPVIEDKVVDLGGHDRMTPEQALVVASREKWDQVVICGFQGNAFCTVNSKMSIKDLLWLAEHLRADAMGFLRDG